MKKVPLPPQALAQELDEALRLRRNSVTKHYDGPMVVARDLMSF